MLLLAHPPTKPSMLSAKCPKRSNCTGLTIRLALGKSRVDMWHAMGWWVSQGQKSPGDKKHYSYDNMQIPTLKKFNYAFLAIIINSIAIIFSSNPSPHTLSKSPPSPSQFSVSNVSQRLHHLFHAYSSPKPTPP